MSLDHGILNVPLAKRGDIDAQLDRYKAEQAAADKAARKARATAFRDQKLQAKQALADILAAPGLVEAKAEKLGVTRAKLVVQMTDWAKWQPANLLAARKQWIEQAK